METQIETVDIILALDQSEDEAARREAAARKLDLSVDRIGETRLRKHSIDARQRTIKVQLRLDVAIDGLLPVEARPAWSCKSLLPKCKRVVIVGSGPAGLFAALRCLELGTKPIILERGKDASARRFDLAPILRHGKVIEDSNYCFGEGGAGTNSTLGPPNVAQLRKSMRFWSPTALRTES